MSRLSFIDSGADHLINETSIAKVGPTTLLAISRSASQTATYAHFSHDMGLTWGPEIDYTSQIGVIQLPQLLQTSTALLLFGRDFNVTSLVVFASYENGVTFAQRATLDAYRPGLDASGYCWPILQSDGSVYVVWSAPKPSGPLYSVIKALTLSIQ